MLGAVSFKAGEREYQCTFTTSAMRAYEAHYDEPFLQLVKKFDGDNIENLRVTFLFELFSLALRACEPDLSESEVADIADQIPPQKMITLIGEAIHAAFPEGDGEGKKKGPAQSKARTPRR